MKRHKSWGKEEAAVGECREGKQGRYREERPHENRNETNGRVGCQVKVQKRRRRREVRGQPSWRIAGEGKLGKVLPRGRRLRWWAPPSARRQVAQRASRELPLAAQLDVTTRCTH